MDRPTDRSDRAASPSTDDATPEGIERQFPTLPAPLPVRGFFLTYLPAKLSAGPGRPWLAIRWELFLPQEAAAPRPPPSVVVVVRILLLKPPASPPPTAGEEEEEEEEEGVACWSVRRRKRRTEAGSGAGVSVEGEAEALWEVEVGARASFVPLSNGKAGGGREGGGEGRVSLRRAQQSKGDRIQGGQGGGGG